MTELTVTQLPSNLDQLATNIHADLEARVRSRAEWVEATINLCVHLVQARMQFVADQDFGKWFDVQNFDLNKDERAAAIRMGANLEHAREVLEKTERRSIQLIEAKEFRFLSVQKPAENQAETNVIRLEAAGRAVRGQPVRRAVGNSKASDKNPSRSPKVQNPALLRAAAIKEEKMAESRERFFSSVQVPKPIEKLPAMTDEERRALHGEPPVLCHKNGRLHGLNELMVYRYADDGEFHSIPRMTAELDPNGEFKLQPVSFQRAAYAMQNERADIHVETRPGPGTQKQYRFYRQGKTIGLSVLKAKFRPVIEMLKIEGQKPISYQSTGRFNEVAALLIQLLRDLEAE